MPVDNNELFGRAIRATSRRVRRLETTRAGGLSGGGRGATDDVPPTQPHDLIATASAENVSLVWSAAYDNVVVAGYQIFRDGTPIATTGVLEYTDGSVVDGVTYSYRVRAYDSSGNYSALSDAAQVTFGSTPTDTTPPTTPTVLAASNVQATSAVLSWNASSDNIGVAGYTVYRNGIPVATTAQLTYTDSALAPSTAYTYTVDAYDDAQNHSGQSSAVIVNTPALPDTDTWYVSTTGSSTNAGTLESPFSLDHVLNGAAGGEIVAGDTIYLLDGVYDLTVTQVVDGLAGTSTDRITFLPYPDARPRLRNQYSTPFHTLEVQDAAYVDFRDIEFTMSGFTRSSEVPLGVAMAHVYENPANTQNGVRFLDCKIHDSAGKALLLSALSNTIFDSCYFYYNGSSTTVDWTAWITSENGSSKAIQNCVFINNASDDLRLYSEDTTGVNDILLDDNFLINTGGLFATPTRSIVVGGTDETPDGITVTGNISFNRATATADSRSIQLGNFGAGSGPTNFDLTNTTSDARFRSDGAFSSSATTLEVGEPSGGLYISSFLLWGSVTIPQGATITSAYLTLEQLNTSAGSTVDMYIRAEDSDNPAAPTTQALAAARARTTAETNWVIGAGWTTGIVNSPDIAALIQEVVDRPGWNSGNNLLIFLDENAGLSNNDIWFASRDHTTAQKPQLHVVYTTGSSDAGIANTSVQSNIFVGQPADLDGSGYTAVTVIDNSFVYDGAHIGDSETDYPSNTWADTYPVVSTAVQIRAYAWDTRRGNILCFNWPGASTFTVTASQLAAAGLTISTGDAYTLCNAENYYSDRIQGVYDGVSIVIPMTGRTRAAPAGGTATPATLFPYMAVFQIIVAGEPSGGTGDTTPPTVPTGLALLEVAGPAITLSWNPSTDAAGVASYRIYRNGVLIDTVAHVDGDISSGTNGDPVPDVGDFYVSPSGSASGDGSSGDPWSLSYLLAGSSPAGAGDTVWLRNGTYQGVWNVSIAGTSGNPLRICAYPGERPVIMQPNGSHESVAWTMYDVQYVEFWNLEFSAPTYSRPSKDDSYQPDGACVQDQTSILKYGVKWYGCIFKNAYGQGYRARDVSRTGWEWNGCQFYYNGAGRFDHGLYTWNEEGSYKLIRNCLFHHNSGHDIHGYNTSSGSSQDDYEIRDNVFWQTTGLYSGTPTGRSILLGDDTNDTNGNTVEGNYTYSNLGFASSNNFAIKVGYVSNGWYDNIIQNNLFVGQGIDFSATPRSGNTISGNRMLGCTAYGDSRSAFPSNTWDSLPTSSYEVYAHAYQYNTQKGNLIIYNWASASAVSVPHAELVAGGLDIDSGDTYRLHNAENYFGDIVTGTYDGTSINLPMTGRTMETPVGASAPTSRSGFPVFGVFVIEVIKSGTPGSETQEYTDTAVSAGNTYAYQIAAVDIYGNVSALSATEQLAI